MANRYPAIFASTIEPNEEHRRRTEPIRIGIKTRIILICEPSSTQYAGSFTPYWNVRSRRYLQLSDKLAN